MASSRAFFRKFDARESWESYSQELEEYFEANDLLDDNERVAILLTVLRPSVYNVLRDFCRPELPRLKTYAELSELLRIHDSPRPSVFKQRIEFYGATQTPDESLNDWRGRIMSLAASCDFGDEFNTVLKDNFVSGLVNRKLARKLCEKNSSATLEDLVDLTEEYALSCTEIGILDLPPVLLNQIILLLTVRERWRLADSCQSLRTHVFEDPKLLRHLDFSEKAHLTTMTRIKRHFKNENASQHVRTVDASNVSFTKAGDPLNNSIGRAINVVEVNIRGTQFENISQLGSFLNPLQHLEKLCIDWPQTTGKDIELCRGILQKPFSKLTYLSVRFEMSALTMLTSCLSLCQQLNELHIESVDHSSPEIRMNSWNSEIKQLTNLKIVQYNGRYITTVKEELAAVLPDPRRWTDFQLCGANSREGFYIEKDVEVCEQLLQSERLKNFLNTAPWENFKFKWALNTEYLLKEVLTITLEHVPKKLWCLSTPGQQQHLLKVEEAKLLLKDPKYPISYFCLEDEVQKDCNSHLLGSAYPNLSELVLRKVTTDFCDCERVKESYFHPTCRSTRYCTVHGKRDDSVKRNSSFKMLVENTPNLRHFTLGDPSGLCDRPWDLDAVRLISGWHNLGTLHLTDVPCKRGQFWIEIGKNCKNLQKLTLKDCSSKDADNDKVALLTMLKYCRNLRDLTILRCNTDQVEMFATLVKNVKLERVEVDDQGTGHFAAPWISAVEKMICRCAKLTRIICSTYFKTEDDVNKAESAVKRIRGECRRPDFQIKVNCYALTSADDKSSDSSDLSDLSDSSE